MKRLSLALLLVGLTLPQLALAETWQNVSLVDQMCSTKAKDNPDGHPTSCLIKCASSGFGIMGSDGTWTALDKGGNKQALALLKSTTKKDHVRVDVTGEKKGEQIQVASLKLAE